MNNRREKEKEIERKIRNKLEKAERNAKQKAEQNAKQNLINRRAKAKEDKKIAEQRLSISSTKL